MIPLYQFSHRRLTKTPIHWIITDVAQVGGYPEYRGNTKGSDTMVPDRGKKCTGESEDASVREGFKR